MPITLSMAVSQHVWPQRICRTNWQCTQCHSLHLMKILLYAVTALYPINSLQLTGIAPYTPSRIQRLGKYDESIYLHTFHLTLYLFYIVPLPYSPAPMGDTESSRVVDDTIKVWLSEELNRKNSMPLMT